MDTDIFMDAQLVTFRQTCAILQISRTTLWRRIKNDPLFPRPVSVGNTNCPRLQLSALKDYVQAVSCAADHAIELRPGACPQRSEDSRLGAGRSVSPPSNTGINR